MNSRSDQATVLCSLSPHQLELARRMRARVYELMPELVSIIEQLVRDGLIRGWRDVVWAGTLEEADVRNAAMKDRTLTYRQFTNLGKKENQKWITSVDY